MMTTTKALIACEKCGTKFSRFGSNPGRYCSRKCWYESKPKIDIFTRLWAKVDKSGGNNSCWIWTGSVLKTGYGSISAGAKQPTKRAHRIAYESVNGPIPEKANVLHTCDNRLCCNPAHHFLGNAKINSDDKISKGRDKNHGEDHHHCKLSTADVSAVKALYISHSGKYIADLFGVSQATISNIVNNVSRLRG